MLHIDPPLLPMFHVLYAEALNIDESLLLGIQYDPEPYPDELHIDPPLLPMLHVPYADMLPDDEKLLSSLDPDLELSDKLPLPVIDESDSELSLERLECDPSLLPTLNMLYAEALKIDKPLLPTVDDVPELKPDWLNIELLPMIDELNPDTLAWIDLLALLHPSDDPELDPDMLASDKSLLPSLHNRKLDNQWKLISMLGDDELYWEKPDTEAILDELYPDTPTDDEALVPPLDAGVELYPDTLDIEP
eukprot:44897-Rhodomonas_salina.2